MKKEQQIYVLIGMGFALFVYVYFSVLLGPVNKNIAAKARKIAETQQTLERAKKEIVVIEELRRKSQLLQLEVSELQGLLPKSKDLPGLLRLVTRIAQKFGVKIITLQPQIMSPKTEYNEMPYTLSIQTNFHSLADFIAELGQEKRLLSFRNINMTPNIDIKQGITINVNMTMIAFMSKDGAQK